jgi:hypothetical protein
MARPSTTFAFATGRSLSLAAARTALLLLLPLCALSACVDDTCFQVEGELGLLCVPDVAAADAPLVLDAREACGTQCARSPVCSAALQGGAVRLTLTEDHCEPGVASCDESDCLRTILSCQIPPLPAGDYPVLMRGGPPELLRVRAGGTAACRLPATP